MKQEICNKIVRICDQSRTQFFDEDIDNECELIKKLYSQYKRNNNFQEAMYMAQTEVIIELIKMENKPISQQLQELEKSKTYFIKIEHKEFIKIIQQVKELEDKLDKYFGELK